MFCYFFEKFFSLLDWRLPRPLSKFISQRRVRAIIISHKPLRHFHF